MVQSDLATSGIFIDSDDLERLDALFSIVAFELNALWALLTRETPFRIWRGGEVNAATREKVHMRLIVGEDYVPTTDETIEGLGNVWAADQW
jgi:hypothetical protein